MLPPILLGRHGAELGLQWLTLEEHAMILEVIEAGDPDAAAKHMADQLCGANRVYNQDNFQAS